MKNKVKIIEKPREKKFEFKDKALNKSLDD